MAERNRPQISITMRRPLLELLDEYAKGEGIERSRMIETAVHEYLMSRVKQLSRPAKPRKAKP